MKLIVGFGNPESRYNFTRHNFGFLTLDFYAKIKNLTWEQNPKFNAIWFKTNGAIFLKPQTYYNEVGKSIQASAHFYKIQPEDILIICDDFDLDFGKIRFREKGSDGGNNGLKSTIRELNSSNFPRLRLGTDSPLRAGHNKSSSSTSSTTSTSSSSSTTSTSNSSSAHKNHPTAKIPDIDFVLSKFTPEEKAQLPDILREACNRIDAFLL